MAKFIEVTFQDRLLMVNIEKIISFKSAPMSAGSVLTIESPTPIVAVTESYDLIKKLISDAQS